MTRRQLSRKKKACFGIVTTGLCLLLIEFALTLLGVGRSTDHADPFVGFSNQVPLFEPFTDDAGKSWLRTAENKLVWFNHQQFGAAKPANTKRIFCVGGSTTFGRPYDDTTSFCGWLREWLPHIDATTNWEVANAGGVSYASYRVATVMQELTAYEPDVFIVYTGQNEFLERRTYADFFDQSAIQLWLSGWLAKTRTYGCIDSILRRQRDTKPNPNVSVLPAEVDERLNHTIGPSDYVRDDEWRRDVRLHFQFNLNRMIDIARASGAKILFVVPASNEKDCSPFKIEPEATDFQDGQSAFAKLDFARAKEAFQTALNLDICPLRAPDEFLDIVRNLPKADDVCVVDFDRQLREVCLAEQGHDLLGDEYFLDHVHPTIDVHRRLSLWIADAMRRSEWLSPAALGTKDIPSETLADVDALIQSRIDPRKQGVALRNLAKVMHWSGKFEVAEARARDAIAKLNGDAESQFILADCLRWTGRIDESVRVYQRAVNEFPGDLRGAQRFGQLLLELGQYETAQGLFSIAVIGWPETNPRHWSARYQLSLACIGLADFESARTELQRCHEHDPKNMDVTFALAESCAGVGDTDTALKLYNRVLDAFPNDVETHVRLGYLQLNRMDPQAAAASFATALLLAPEHPQAQAGKRIASQLIATQSKSSPRT